MWYPHIQLPPPIHSRTHTPFCVQITELPEWAQLAFGGYKSLNRIQSRIFHTAFSSNENMLVCAPTGVPKHLTQVSRALPGLLRPP